MSQEEIPIPLTKRFGNKPSLYNYALSSNGKYWLYRFNKPVIQGTAEHLDKYVRRHHGYDIDHAWAYEGYRMVPQSPIK